MRDAAIIGASVLLAIGTAGLLINEFVLDWGRATTVTFAVVNVVGLALLTYTHWRVRQESR